MILFWKINQFFGDLIYFLKNLKNEKKNNIKILLI